MSTQTSACMDLKNKLRFLSWESSVSNFFRSLEKNTRKNYIFVKVQVTIGYYERLSSKTELFPFRCPCLRGEQEQEWLKLDESTRKEQVLEKEEWVYLTSWHYRAQEWDLLIVDFEIGNKTDTFIETPKNGVFTPEWILPEEQIKPEKTPKLPSKEKTGRTFEPTASGIRERYQATFFPKELQEHWGTGKRKKKRSPIVSPSPIHGREKALPPLNDQSFSPTPISSG